MVDSDRIIDYLKPRITNVIQHNHFVSSDMSSTTIDNRIYLNLTAMWILFIHLKDGSKYEAMDYIEDRFGYNYDINNLIILREFLKKYELPF